MSLDNLRHAQYGSDGVQIDDPQALFRSLWQDKEGFPLNIGTVVPSGDASGLTDTILMQAVLDAGISLTLMSDGIYYTDKELTLASGANIKFNPNARIKRCNSFTGNLTTTTGSTIATLTGTGNRIVRPLMNISGIGLSRPCRIESISGQTVTLTRPAKVTGTNSVTIHPGHNILFSRETSGVSVTATIPGTLGYLDGNLAASCPWINASLDSQGSGFRFEGCSNWTMDGIKPIDNQYHGGFFTSTPSSGNSLNIRIGYYEAENNGVRGLHGRAEGGAGSFGINDVEIDTIVVRKNGRLWVNHAMPYDISNGGFFVQVAGVRRLNIKSFRAYDEYGIAYQAVGNDSGAAGADSEKCSVGSMIINNCGYGIHFNRGIKDHSTGSLFLNSDRIYATAGFGCDINTITEISRPSLEADWLEYYMVVGTISLPAAWTAAQVAQIDPGDLINLASTSGVIPEGCVVVSVNYAAKTVQAYCINDPLGISVDNTSGLVTSVTPGGAGAITLNGAQTSAGVSNYSGARKINITSTGNISNRNFTITGTAWDGSAYSEVLAGPNNTTVQTSRLFKTVTSISIDGAAAAAITIGTCLARPFTSTQANIAGAWRAERSAGLNYVNNVTTATNGNVKNIHFNFAHIEGCGGYGVLFSNAATRAATAYEDITFGKLKIVETLFGFRTNYCKDVNIGQLYLDTIGRGWGSDGSVLLEDVNSSGMRIGTFIHRHDATKFTCAGEVVNVTSSSSDVMFGPYKSDTSIPIHARFNGTGCSLIKPLNSSTGAALVLTTNVAGTGSPIIWNPA